MLELAAEPTLDFTFTLEAQHERRELVSVCRTLLSLGVLHRVAGGQIRPPLRAGSMAEPMVRMLAADPADRPTMVEVRDELAALAAGRDGDTTTVLLARTDLRSGPPGPDRTATFPAPAVETPDPPPPPPARPPAAAPARPPAPPPGSPDRRRGRAVWVAAALVALLLGGLVIFWAVALDDEPGPSADPTSTTSAESTAASSAEQSTESAASTTAEQTTDAPADGAALSAKNVRDFLEDYHEAVLEDPRAAYDTLTGPTLQANVSYETYAEFWGRFSDVKLKDVQAEDGSTTATATIEFTENGEKFTEAHQFTLAVGEDGQLLMDVDSQVG